MLMFVLVLAADGIVGTTAWRKLWPLSPNPSTTSSSSSGSSSGSKWDHFDGYAKVSQNFRLVEQVPHDPKAFCQGLDLRSDGLLVESTGMYGESLVRVYDPRATPHADGTPLVVAEHKMDHQYFGEGLCGFTTQNGEERYLQLTWKEQKAFVYDSQLEIVDQFTYTTSTKEGWGVAWDPHERVFYVSDGSEVIAVWNDSFQEIRSFQATVLLAQNKAANRTPLKRVNELEWDPAEGGTLLANVWYQNIVVRIHPRTGAVLEAYDLTPVYPPAERDPSADVLNGIAPCGQPGLWWITGKYWPHLYLVELY